MITATEPVIPPIPTVPIADPATGRCAREWWLWFNQVFQVALAQQGQIDLATTFPFIPPDPIDVSIDVLAALTRQTLADPPGEPLALVAMQAPSDSVSPDQIAMRALSMGVMA